MAPAATGGAGLEVENLIAQRRLELAGKPGLAGLLENGRTFSIAVFASLGYVVLNAILSCDSNNTHTIFALLCCRGLVYGYNQVRLQYTQPSLGLLHTASYLISI